MTDEHIYIIDKIPENGTLAKYEKELLLINYGKSKEDIYAFSERIWHDCVEYLETVFSLNIPLVFLKLMNNIEYAQLGDKLERELGERPQSGAVIVGHRFSPPDICINLENHLKGKPIDFIINLCTSYIEELVHSSDPKKTETQIQELVCSAIEGFLEIKLPDAVKQARLDNAKRIDKAQSK